MQQLQIKKEDITEEMILNLVNYFDTGVLPEWMTESRIWQLYWRLRARWNKIDKAEEKLQPLYERKAEGYKRKKTNEIQQWIHDIKNENWGVWHYEYEIANIKEREKGRTMQIWFIDTDPQTNKTKWRHSVEIEERHNPTFFEEMLNKYMPHNALPEDKPF